MTHSAPLSAPAGPPAAVKEVATAVDDRLRRLFDEEEARWRSVDPRLAEATDELRRMSTGGKRLRAAFCYWAWRGAHEGRDPAGSTGADRSLVIDAGTAFELLQTFALIHDDIMDDAATRRSEQTIHTRQAERLTEQGWRGEPRRYGEGVAILLGDLSHVYADRLVGPTPPAARRLWDELRIELNLGQYLDMRTAAAGEFDRAVAQRVATFKSALYTIVRPLQFGAALVVDDADPGLLDALDAFGRPVGQAFQLRDDLLGVLGDADRVGKPVGHDLRDGKPTELVAVAAEAADASQRVVLETIGRPDLDDAGVSRLLEVLHATGAIAEIERRIDELVEHATGRAADLPFPPQIRQTLIDLARYVAARSN